MFKNIIKLNQIRFNNIRCLHDRKLPEVSYPSEYHVNSDKNNYKNLNTNMTLEKDEDIENKKLKTYGTSINMNYKSSRN